MPFPSTQGTQAIVASMMRALPNSTLLTYAVGSGSTDIDLVRLSDFPRVRSLRSGPSLGKLVLDARMIGELRRRVRQLRPDWIIAHNVEAAWVTWAARVRPWAYFAHTRFDTELPTYSSLPGLRHAGAALDAIAVRADRVLAITPKLAEHLGGTFVMPPWPPGHIPERERPLPGPVVLYAGNLDAYQGLDVVYEATRGLTLLVATESTDPLPPHAQRWPLANEADRRRAHAAADVVVVPRKAPGGLPIKLLDALSRDVPVVAQRRALAGLNPDGVLTVPNDDPAALRWGIETALANPPSGGREWIKRHASKEEFARRVFRVIRNEAR